MKVKPIANTNVNFELRYETDKARMNKSDIRQVSLVSWVLESESEGWSLEFHRERHT